MKHLVYGGTSVTHNDFVFDWRPQLAGGGGAADGGGSGRACADDLEGLPPFARDLLSILLGRVCVRFQGAAPHGGKL